MLYGSWQIVVTVNTMLAPQNNYVQLFVTDFFVTVNTLFAQPNNYVQLFVTVYVQLFVTANTLFAQLCKPNNYVIRTVRTDRDSCQLTYVLFANIIYRIF